MKDIFKIDFYDFSVRIQGLPEWRNWYTRATQNRVSQGLEVQVLSPAHIKTTKQFLFGCFIILN
jgi:hypothetical protein